MIAFDYARPAATAERLLTRFGQVVTVKRVTPGGYDPATGEATPVETSQVGTGALFDFGLHQSGTAFAPDSMILVGDKKLLLSPVGVSQPAPGDRVAVGADLFSVVNVKITAPAGVVVMYECQLRK